MRAYCNLLDCVAIGYCVAEIYKDYEWPQTDIGDSGSSDCTCSDVLGTLAGRAFRFCGGDGVGNAQWSEKVNMTECVAITSDTTKRLCQIARVSIMYLLS